MNYEKGTRTRSIRARNKFNVTRSPKTRRVMWKKNCSMFAEIRIIMEDRKATSESGGTSTRVIGSKVSQIANIFQSKGQPSSVSEPELLHVPHKVKRDSSISPKRDHQKELFKEPKSTLASVGDAVCSQITVVRTESHVARFNSAKALFEKLGTSKSRWCFFSF